MANEIQAIATNNYVLATQQAVTHDGSLSGNGTVNSPLSVVPATVQTYTAKSDIVASEVATGFGYNDIGVSKQGNLVCFSLLFDPMSKLSMPSNTWNYMFTIKDQFIPVNVVNGVWSTVNSTSPFYGNFRIDTSGKFYIRQQTTNNAQQRSFNVVYFTS